MQCLKGCTSLLMHHFTKYSPSKLKKALVRNRKRSILCFSDQLSFSMWTENQHYSSNTDWLTQNGCLGLKEAGSQSSSSCSGSSSSSSPDRANLLLVSLSFLSLIEKRLTNHQQTTTWLLFSTVRLPQYHHHIKTFGGCSANPRP